MTQNHTTDRWNQPHTRPRRLAPLALWLPLLVTVALLAGFAALGRPVFLRAGESLAYVPTATPRYSAATPWTDSHCGTCHRVDAMFSHPVNVTPSMTVPSYLPLEAGRVTCLTCHDGDTPERHAQARQDHTALLRGPAGESSSSAAGSAAFCAQCHRADAATIGAALGFTSTGASPAGRKPAKSQRASERAALHPTMQLSAHLRWPDRAGVRGVRAAFAGGFTGSDSQTRQCLTCHDGSVATDAGTAPVATFNSSPGLHTNGHPVGIPYPAGRTSTGQPLADYGLVSAAMIDARIQLVDGQVACTSCHSPYSGLDSQLVMSNYRSALCMTCHKDR